MRLLVLLCLVLLGVREWAAGHVGFGDSEALYAAYALHPQPAYLDHPGLVGLVARLLGDGAAPSPATAHALTAIVVSALPLLVARLARSAGASPNAAAVAGAIFAVTPEIAVGLFALTPDLLLAPLWLGALALALHGLGPEPSTAPATTAAEEAPRKKKQAPGARKKPAPPAPPPGRADWRRPAALAFAGLLAGVAASAKVSGLLLVVALAYAFARLRVRSRSAWAGLVAGLLVFAPVVVFEVRSGFPMLRHRLVELPATVPVHGAALALRNVGALLGGQLLYLSPLVAVLAVLVAHDLVRQRATDRVATLLFAAFAIPLVPLLVLCLVSPVAEPHWLAPPLLVLPVHAARRGGIVARRLVVAAGALAATLTAAVHAWILIPDLSRLLPASADPRVDISNELFGWPQVADAVRASVLHAATPEDPEGQDVVVVGPHWTVCAQLAAALPGRRVGCATAIPDDFDRWLPRARWRAAENVLWVTDNRFPNDGKAELPNHAVLSQGSTRLFRGGRITREFSLTLYSRRALSLR